MLPVLVYVLVKLTGFLRQVFGKDGWYDLSHDLNWRVNYSGFAAIAAVQVFAAHLLTQHLV